MRWNGHWQSESKAHQVRDNGGCSISQGICFTVSFCLHHCLRSLLDFHNGGHLHRPQQRRQKARPGRHLRPAIPRPDQRRRRPFFLFRVSDCALNHCPRFSGSNPLCLSIVAQIDPFPSQRICVSHCLRSS